MAADELGDARDRERIERETKCTGILWKDDYWARLNPPADPSAVSVSTSGRPWAWLAPLQRTLCEVGLPPTARWVLQRGSRVAAQGRSLAMRATPALLGEEGHLEPAGRGSAVGAETGGATFLVMGLDGICGKEGCAGSKTGVGLLGK